MNPAPLRTPVVQADRMIDPVWATWFAELARAVTRTPGLFATLPAAPVEGQLASITDASTAVWGATIAGGGANHVLAYFDGTNWTVAAK